MQGAECGVEESCSEPCPLLLCCVTHTSYSTPLIFSFPEGFRDLGDRVEADVRESSGHLQRRGYSGSIFASPLWTQIPPAESPDFGCRCGLTMQCRYQILGCGAKPFHTPDMAAVLGGRQGRFIVLILRMRKLSLEEGQ